MLGFCFLGMTAFEIRANTVPDYVEVSRALDNKYLETYFLNSPDYELAELEINQEILNAEDSSSNLEELLLSISENKINMEAAKVKRDAYALSGNQVAVVGLDEIKEGYEKKLENEYNNRFNYRKEEAIGNYYKQYINDIGVIS